MGLSTSLSYVLDMRNARITNKSLGLSRTRLFCSGHGKLAPKGMITVHVQEPGSYMMQDQCEDVRVSAPNRMVSLILARDPFQLLAHTWGVGNAILQQPTIPCGYPYRWHVALAFTNH